MIPVNFHAQAKAELREARDYYENCAPGLGDRFLNAAEEAVHKIARCPTLYRVVERNTRKVQVAGFPYGILFQLKEHHIFVLAVMHLHRNPSYWKHR